MSNKRWFEQAEAAWRRDWKEVGGVLRDSLVLVCKIFGDFVLFIGLLLLFRFLWQTVPLRELEGWRLYAVANSVSYLLLLANFCVLLVLYHLSISRMRDGMAGFSPQFFRRLGKALPYGLCVHLLFDWFSGFLWIGLTSAGNMAFGTVHNGWTFSAAYYVSALPALFILCRYGFVLIGAAVGDTVTFRDAFSMSRGSVRPLMFTAFFWFFCLEIPVLIITILHSIDSSWMFDLGWLFKINRSVVTVFFAVVSAVWYEKLRLRHEAESEAESLVKE